MKTYVQFIHVSSYDFKEYKNILWSQFLMSENYRRNFNIKGRKQSKQNKKGENRMNSFKWKSIKNYIKMTGELAKIDKIHNTYTVYIKDGQMVKEYSNGKINVVDGEIK